MKLDRLILKKIIKIVATRCQILRLKCTKFDFGPQTPLGELTALPTPPRLDSRGLLLKGGMGRGGVEERRGSKEGERKGEVRTPGTCLHPPDMKS